MPDVTICLTSDEATERLKALPGGRPSDRMGGGTSMLLRIQSPEDQSPYVRMRLWTLYTELARLIGESGPMTPQQFLTQFVLAGSAHSDLFHLDEAIVRELQRHMRDALIPALIADEAARAAVTRIWDQYFGSSAEGSS